jgi:hypothetical protein
VILEGLELNWQPAGGHDKNPGAVGTLTQREMRRPGPVQDVRLS